MIRKEEEMVAPLLRIILLVPTAIGGIRKQLP